jgi:hypothetical protein
MPPLFGSPVDYTDASSITFVQADRSTTTYAASREKGDDTSIEGFLGVGALHEDSFDIGAYITKANHLKTYVGVRGQSETAFELEVELPKIEPDIFERIYNDDGSNIFKLDAKGAPIKKPGKVDAYRFMTFFLAPDHDHHSHFFKNVVDHEWLQGNEPGAVALRQARDDARRPACWRIMHRVTYVSRVLPEIASRAPDSMEKAMQPLDIDSNYELIKAFEPYVINKRGSYAEFIQAIDQALKAHYSDLEPFALEIKHFLCLYYEVPEGVANIPVESE